MSVDEVDQVLVVLGLDCPDEPLATLATLTEHDGAIRIEGGEDRGARPAGGVHGNHLTQATCLSQATFLSMLPFFS